MKTGPTGLIVPRARQVILGCSSKVTGSIRKPRPTKSSPCATAGERRVGAAEGDRATGAETTKSDAQGGGRSAGADLRTRRAASSSAPAEARAAPPPDPALGVQVRADGRTGARAVLSASATAWAASVARALSGEG